MAKKEDDEGAENKEETGGKKSKKTLIIIIVAVLVLVGGGVGGYFMMAGKKAPEEGEDGGEHGEEGEASGEAGEDGHGELPGAMVPLETFIVNLKVKGSFLKCAVQLEFAEPEQPHTLDADLPKVRDAIIRILTSKDSQEVLSSEGKERLKNEVKDAVNQTLGSEDVVNVYFTEFIVQ